jgi:acyl-coenzyme A thioesterase PaaI-like protein
MKVSFLRPLFVGNATAEARILKWGKSTCFIEADLFDPDGKLVARASATQAPKPFKRF